VPCRVDPEAEAGAERGALDLGSSAIHNRLPIQSFSPGMGKLGAWLSEHLARVGSHDPQPWTPDAVAAAGWAPSGRMQGAGRETASAVLALGGIDPQAPSPGTERALDVAEVFLEVPHRHLELLAELLELPSLAGQGEHDPLPLGQRGIHREDCTGHHRVTRKVASQRDLRRLHRAILVVLGYIEIGMTETQESGAGSTLSDDVRRSLLELVEKGLAGAQHLRLLAAEGPTQLTSKGELLGLLDERIGTAGLTVTAGTLTNLAVINQIYGFAVGDLLQELTRSTTALVLQELDPGARVAQIAGAQFVILHGATGQERVAATVRRLQQACNAVALNPHRRLVVPRVAMVSLEVPHDDGLDAA